MWDTFDVLIIGAGLSGAVLAERYASLGKKVLVIEKRNHIGGNCYDEVNSDGIRVSKYGAHIFHTNDEEVHQYIHTFSEWVPYEHKVLAKVGRLFVPIPANITTVNALFRLDLRNEDEMRKWLDTQQVKYSYEPRNSEELGLNRFGKELFTKLFLSYTKKQWEKHPRELDASVVARIPVRFSADDRYFSDKYQYLPKHGYTPFFERLLGHPNIHVRLHTDYFEMKEELSRIPHRFEKVFYTGPIDQFFEFQQRVAETLEYRSLRFEAQWHDLAPKKNFWHPAAVVNYPSRHVPFTRTVEYKHLTQAVSAERVHTRRTIVMKEFSTSVGEPYYPVPSERNLRLYETYKKHADALSAEGLYFVGRLANYKYFNMDQAIKNALELFQHLEQ